MSVYVQNKPGTTNLKAPNGWRAYWEDYWKAKKKPAKWPHCCPVMNTKFKNPSRIRPCDEIIGGSAQADQNGVGAHVLKVDANGNVLSKTVYIVPLCKFHNGLEGDGWAFEVADSLLVPAP